MIKFQKTRLNIYEVVNLFISWFKIFIFLLDSYVIYLCYVLVGTLTHIH
jgi:hypothetical protein